MPLQHQYNQIRDTKNDIHFEVLLGDCQSDGARARWMSALTGKWSAGQLIIIYYYRSLIITYSGPGPPNTHQHIQNYYWNGFRGVSSWKSNPHCVE